MVSEDTEITLGLGRMLGLFFLLVAICGVFLSIGYSLGKSNAREQALNDEAPSQVLAAAPPAATASEQSADKPSAAVASKADAAQPAQEQTAAANPQNNLTFYKAVQQDGASGPVTSKDSALVTGPDATAPTETADATGPQNGTPAKGSVSRASAPPIARSVPVTGPGTIVVQIAAVTREDDAVALAGALRKKDYNVIVVKNPAINDKFYHVQVGPFTTLKDADAMKARLVAEGYNPIVKK
jgi:cell division septation protein DedD